MLTYSLINLFISRISAPRRSCEGRRADRGKPNVLEELDALVVVHDGPDVAEASVLQRSFDDDRQDAGKHEADLYHVRPHHRLHSALQSIKQPVTIKRQSNKV